MEKTCEPSFYGAFRKKSRRRRSVWRTGLWIWCKITNCFENYSGVWWKNFFFVFQSGLRIGQDYNESDVESDTTDLRHTFRSKTNVNLTLTRKKYCQSTKVYYNIFNSEFEFEQLQNQIKAMRKHVFNIAFNLFLQNVPTEKLPNELWEKIWKITLLEKEPDMSPTHSSGTREKIRKWTLFENERITDCFGAAGNIHMILFEILYKHAQIMLPPHLVSFKSNITNTLEPRGLPLVFLTYLWISRIFYECSTWD